MTFNERRVIYAVEQRMGRSGSRFSDIIEKFSGRNDSKRMANALRDLLNNRQQKRGWPHRKCVTVKYVPAAKA